MTRPKAIVIGAGIAGIASAIRLALKGYEVDIFENNSQAGGKLQEINLQGFRFDTGPSLFTMPQYVDELFLLAGRNPKDYYKYTRLDEICRYFYEDGLQLSAHADIQKFAAEIEQKTESSADELYHYLKKSKGIFETTHKVFLERSLHKLKSFLHRDTVQSALNFRKIDAFRTMQQANRTAFKDPRIVQLFNRYATYNGSNPFQAPATLNVIPHFEYGSGAYLPEKGMYAIVKALVKLAEELKISFHFSTPVDEITVKDNYVKGIRCGDKLHDAEIVVSNLDIRFTYHRLLSGLPRPEKWLRQERSSSALIFYWGINRSFENLGLHNIFFAHDYEAEFDAIWKEKTIYQDPTVYINITSKQIKTDAPEDSENWFVMINVPSDSGQDWAPLIRKAKEDIIKKLNRALKTDISPYIICEQVLDPRKIESATGSYRGSLYGNSSNNKFSAFLRHPNFSTEIKNLFFCGGSVHPGGGIPLALLSAKIVGDNVPF